MTLTSALAEIENLGHAVTALPGSFDHKVLCPSAPIRDWYSTWHATLFDADRVSSPEVIQRFGVYLLATAPQGKLLYVGKATPGAHRSDEEQTRYHLAAEIWKKLGTTKFIDGTLQFVGGVLETKSRISELDRRAIRDGNVLVAAVEVRPWECISYVEIYIQAVVCRNDGCLPDANDRIG